jgi:anthranilate synthase component 1
MLTYKHPTHLTDRNENRKLLTFVRELPADLDTPVSIYLKLAGQKPSFLLESVTGGEQVARYSFIGVNPSQAFVLRNRSLEIHKLDGRESENIINIREGKNPLDVLRQELPKAFQDPSQGNLPRFSGGLVGYLGYEMVRFFEPTLSLANHSYFPDAIFLHADTLVAFDHAFGRMLLITNVPEDNDTFFAQQEAQERLDTLEDRISSRVTNIPDSHDGSNSSDLQSNMTREEFIQAVLTAKEHIAAGDIFQVVLSQRLSKKSSAHPFAIYRTLRRLNPSPYMFYFNFANLAGEKSFQMIGASPEMHARFEDGVATLRPIAGTRPRGRTLAEDLKLEGQLLADPKERAEHVMLLDLARNDLGRVCKYGSVHVPEKMVVERYSHVMHIVSHTKGKLRPELDAFDLLKATFPAGTVSGAPKICAMEIINDLEKDPRGPYAGAVGYFSYDGTSDTCITIRTMTMLDQTVEVQAGAGIVADSDPQREYEETLNKARALAVAVETAENVYQEKFLYK